MAGTQTVHKSALVEVNSVDLSDHVTDVIVRETGDFPEATAMGTGYRTFKSGIRNAEIQVTFLADEAASEVNATLFPLHNDGTSFTVKWKPDKNSSTSDTNPQYSGTCLLLNYTAINAEPNTITNVPVTFVVSGNLTRADS